MGRKATTGAIMPVREGVVHDRSRQTKKTFNPMKNEGQRMHRNTAAFIAKAEAPPAEKTA